MATNIYVKKIFDAEIIAASASATSDPTIDLMGIEGNFSIQVEIAGDGTAKFEYLLSINGDDYLEPSGATDIATGKTKTSGPGSDGKDIFNFTPETARFLKIKVTETGTTDSITVTVWVCIQ